MKAISKIFIFVFNPAFILFYLFLYLIFETDIFFAYLHTFKLSLLLGYLFVNSVILPVLFSWIITRSIVIHDKSKIPITYLVGLTMYLIIYIFMSRFPFPPIVISFIFSILSGLLFLILFNNFYNISLYSTSAGALMSLFVYLFITDPMNYMYSLMFILILSGLVGSSRIYLKTNSPFEVYSGYLLGFINTMIVLLIRS